jgi:hypothetical protein
MARSFVDRWNLPHRVHLVIPLAIAAVTCATAYAQQSDGSVTGTIHDTSGAIIKSADVTLTNQATQATFKTKTNDAGLYAIQLLPIGNYQVRVASSGFSAEVQQFELHGGDRLKLDLQLHPGSAEQTITVSTEPPLLEAQSGDSGMTITSAQTQNLPLLGRNTFLLATLTPGVAIAPGQPANISQRPFDNGGFDAIGINGSHGFTTEVTIDGLADTGSEQASSSQVSNINFVPSPDMTSEFRVQSSVYDAQFGRSGGGIIAVNLKSGTNRIHGVAYDYIRSQALNANDYADDRAGNAKSGFHWSQPGLVVSGPVFIPKLYDGRNKTFWMFGWENVRTTTPQPTYSTVPSALEKTGDFSQSLAGNKPNILYDPLTTTAAPGGGYTRQSFGSTIPQLRIDPVAAKIASLLPAPNNAVAGAGDNNNLFSGLNNTLDAYDAFTYRVDHTINDKHRISATYLYSDRHQTSGTNGYPVAITPEYEHYRTNFGAHITWNWVMSPTLVSSFGVGWNEHRFAILNEQPSYDLSTLGFPAYMSHNAAPTLFPLIAMAGYSNFGNAGFGTGNLNYNDTYDLRETLTKTLKRHGISFGGEIRPMRTNNNQYAGNSNFTFGRDFTQANPLASDSVSGNAFASFLLGYADGGSVSNNPRRDWHNDYYALFIQDSWHVTDKMTVTAGLRWDTESPIREVHGQANTSFNPTATYGFAGVALNGVVGYGSGSPYDWDKNNFGPRVGFAYAVSKNLLMRGGIGILYNPTFDNSSSLGFSASTAYVASLNNLLTPALPSVLSNPYPAGFVVPAGAASNINGQGGFQYWANHKRNIPRTTQFSLGFEYQLPMRSILDVHYAGQITDSQPNYRNANFTSTANLALGNALNDQLANPFAGKLPGTSINGATWSRQQSLLPFPQYTGFTQVTTDASSNYNGLQVRFEKRVTHGLNFLASYAYSKILRTEYLNDQDTEQIHYMDGADQPHVFSISGGYVLPFFKDRHNGIVKQALGGWQANIILSKSSGVLYGPPGGVQATGVDPHISNPTPQKYFNTCTITATGTLQNCDPGQQPVWAITQPFALNHLNPLYGGFRTPIPITTNFSIFKTFPIWNTFNLQFRAEAFNLTNTPQFGGPDTGVNSPTFGQLTNYIQTNIPRNVQIALRLNF